MLHIEFEFQKPSYRPAKPQPTLTPAGVVVTLNCGFNVAKSGGVLPADQAEVGASREWEQPFGKEEPLFDRGATKPFANGCNLRGR